MNNTTLHTIKLLFLTLLFSTVSWGQTYYAMSGGNYSQTFTNLSTSYPTNFNGLAILSTGSIPVATKTTTATNSTLAVVGSSTAIGYDAVSANSTKMIFLCTGTTDSSVAVACDLNLDFTGRTAGSLAFNYANILNGSVASPNGRSSSLIVYYSTDGSTWTSLGGPYTVYNNTGASTANVPVSISLPSALNNQGTVKLRFYEYNGGTVVGTPSGSRPKISLDDISVTSTAITTVPTVTLPTAASVATTTATLGATVTADGGATITSRGTVWDTTASPTANAVAEGGTGISLFTQARTGFTPNTLYYYRGYAVNSVGTGYSPDGTFTTISNAPTVGTGSGATTTGITANWTAPTGGGSATYTYTVQVSTDNTFATGVTQQTGIASGTLSAAFTGLTSGTVYYYRVCAVNAGGSSAWSSTSVGYSTLVALSPTIAVTPTTLSGFTYVLGAGPSTEQSFTASGSSLTANISIAPPTDYEISTGTGGSFVATNPITLTQSGGTVNTTTIYVRLKAGLSVASYTAENITTTSAGSNNPTVACSGSVSAATPTIAISTGTLSGFTYLLTYGPSAEQTYTVSGSNLVGDITITPSANYEISLTTNTGFGSAITLTKSGSTVGLTTIYVRLKAGLSVASYNSEIIAATSSGATSQNVTCSGSVTAGSSTCLNEDFTSGFTWTNSGTASTSDSALGHYGAASPCRALGSLATAITPAINNPNTLQFYEDASTGGSGSTATIDYRIGAGAWTSCYSFAVNSAGSTISVDLTNIGGVDLSQQSSVSFRFNSSFNTWYLDDVVVLCGTTCTPPSNPSGSITGTTPACGSTTLSYSGTASNPVVNYWQTSATGVLKTNNASSTISVSASASYYVRAYNAPTNCWSSTAVGPYAVVINTTPSISVNPIASSIASGANTTFGVTASGTGITYQWQVSTGGAFSDLVNSSIYSNVTTATMGITGATYSMNGYSYRCVVSASPCTAATSTSATLTVAAPPAPVISSSLTKSTVYGTADTYTITASNSPTSFSTGTLPTGFTLSGAVITKADNVVVGAYSISISATNVGGTDTKTLVWTVTQKPLTVTGLTGINKVYDGSTTATVSGTAALTGIVFSDDVTLSGTPTLNFADANVGTSKTITVTGYSLLGTKAGNYTATQPSPTANITAKPLSISTPTIATKVYNASAVSGAVTVGTLSGLVGTETIVVTATGVYPDANAAIGKTATVTYVLANGTNGGLATNYSLASGSGTGDITKADPVFTVVTIPITIGATYTLPGANVASTSDGSLSYSITGGGFATLSGTTITAVSAGTETLTINQAASTNYNAGSTTVGVTVSACSLPTWDENFNYGACDGSNLPDLTSNWVTFSGTAYNSQYKSTSLTYNPYPSSGIGGSYSFETGGSDDIKRDISASGISSGNVYSSFLINMNSNTSTSDDYFLSLIGDPSSITYSGRVYIKKEGTQYRLGVGKQSSSGSAADASTSLLNFDQTYLVVIKYEFVAGGVNDPFKLWVISSGVPASEAAAGTPITATLSGTDATNIKSFAIRQTNKAKGSIDGIRVATTWENLFCGNAASATNYTWTGAVSSSWSNAGNWSPSGVPSNIDNIIISSPGANLLNITDCRTVANFTLNGTGSFTASASGIFTINGDVAYGGTANAVLDCASQVFIKSASSQPIPPLTYGNLDVLGGNRVFPNGGTIKICGGFNVVPDPSTSIYTVTGSTVEYISPASGWTLTPFTYNNLTINCTTGDYSFGYSSPAVSKTVNVLGNYLQTSGTIYLGETSSATATINIYGNMTISGGTFDINRTSGGSGVINLKGDLLVGSSALLSASSTTIANTNINFTGTGDGLTAATTQTIDIASTSTSENKYTSFNVKSGAYVQLANRNFELGTNSKVTVEDGGVLDFGFSGTTPLIITKSGSQTGTAFTSAQGSTLKITSPDGISTTGTIGNVQVVSSNISFSTVATFHYIGKTNQVTGNGIGSTSSGKAVIVELDTNSLQLSLSQSFGITSAVNANINGGLGGILDIRKGQVIETTLNYITGSTGGLSMADGTLYQIPSLSTSSSDVLPRMSGLSSVYNLSGSSTIELNGTDGASAYDQYFRGARVYRNLIFSNAGVKTILEGISSITGTVTVKNAAVLDVSNNTMGGSGTDLTMTDTAQYITAGTGTKPDAQGTYSLGAGTKISFSNVAATLERIRLTNAAIVDVQYYNIDVVGSSVGTTSTLASIKMQAGGTFTVKNTGTFKFNNTDGFTGSTTTAISSTNNPTVTLEATSTVEYAGTDQTVTTFSPYYAYLKFSGTGIKTIPATASANTYIDVNKDLTVTGVTLQVNNNNKNLNLNYNTYLTVTNQFINSAGTVNFEDGSSLVQVTDGIVNSGSVNYKRITNIRKTDYVYWSTPVASFGVNNIWSTANYIYKWNTTVANYNNGIGDWESASGATMTNGVGYIVRGPSGTSLNTTTPSDYPATFAGVPNNGTVSVPITKGAYTGADYPGTNGTTITNYDDNMNLVGNPYPSAINAHDFLVANANIEGSIQVWTHGTQLSNTIASPYYGSFAYNYTSADYITYNDLGASSGPSTFNGYIGAGQAFFVKMLDAAAGTTVTFTNAMRSKGYTNNKFYRIRNPQRVEPRDIDSNPVERNRIWLDLIAPTGAAVRTLVGYVEGATLDKDRMYDAYSDYQNDQNFFSLIGKEIMNIQGRPLPFDVNDSVPMGVAIPKAGNYTIAIAAVDGLFEDRQQTIYLEDKLLNVVHNLSASPYTFSIVKGIVKDRFVLRYTDKALGTIDFKTLNNSVVVASKSNQMTIKSFIEDIKNIEIYDVLGREVFAKNNVNAMEFLVKDLNLSQQALLIKITLANGQTVVKKSVY